MKSHNPELLKLLDELLQETITADRHIRLQEILRSSEDARQEYFSYLDIHLGIHDLKGGHQEELLPGACRLEKGSSPESRRRSPLRVWRSTAICGIAALGLLLAYVPKQHLPEPEDVGQSAVVPLETPSQRPLLVVTPEASIHPVTLTQAANVELLLEYVPAIGSPLKVNHEYVLLKGLIELTFRNGAVVTLKSPSVFTVNSVTRMEMKMGNCSVNAPESAKGFEVLTPQGRVVDLGTRFSIVSSDSGVSDVQVVEGAVEIYPLDESEHFSTLLEGEAVRATLSSSALEPIQFDQKQYQKPFPSRVISYEAIEVVPGGGVSDLSSVTVQRGEQIMTYPANELIGIDVIHFSSYSTTTNAVSLDEVSGNIDRLLSDNVALTSGLLNFSRRPGPYVPATDFTQYRERYGMAVRFRKPVVNEPGPDIVLFEVQSAAYPASGDPFYVSPIENGRELRTHLVKRYDVPLNSSDAKRVATLSSHVFADPIRSLEDFSRIPVSRVTKQPMPFFALAVGIDLTDLGYPEGAAVPGLFFEDVEDDEHVLVDPVFIGGFPPLQPVTSSPM